MSEEISGAIVDHYRPCQILITPATTAKRNGLDIHFRCRFNIVGRIAYHDKFLWAAATALYCGRYHIRVRFGMFRLLRRDLVGKQFRGVRTNNQEETLQLDRSSRGST